MACLYLTAHISAWWVLYLHVASGGIHKYGRAEISRTTNLTFFKKVCDSFDGSKNTFFLPSGVLSMSKRGARMFQ